MCHLHNKFMNETKEYIKTHEQGEIYVFKNYQLKDTIEFLNQEGISYVIITADYYKVIKFG